MLSRTESWPLLTLSAACLAVAANTSQGDEQHLIASLAFSGLAFSATFAIVRWAGPSFLKAGRKGRDMSKTNAKEIPEMMGAVAAAVYLLLLDVFKPFCDRTELVTATPGRMNGEENRPYKIGDVNQAPLDKVGPFTIRIENREQLSTNLQSQWLPYDNAFGSIACITILGIFDDMLDLRWRHKFFIPAIAAFPLLFVYACKSGVTFVVVPKFLVSYMPNGATLIDLGYLYYLYMAALAIFTPHSINILAGINGIEVGQSIVVAVLLVLNSSLYLVPFPGNPVLSSAYPQHPHPATDLHLLSLYLLLPLLGVSLALYAHNRYPARVFVGDTYCYFAGWVFACVAILAHFSKTLLLVLVPQILNFVYSVPQIFHIVPCPRHRLPKFNARTGLLEPSVTEWPRDRPPGKTLTAVFTIMAKLRLLQITIDPETNRISTTSNLTILNLWLVWFGPMREDRLAWQILSMQMLCGVLGLFVRHTMALWLFGIDNRGSGMV